MKLSTFTWLTGAIRKSRLPFLMCSIAASKHTSVKSFLSSVLCWAKMKCCVYLRFANLKSKHQEYSSMETAQL